MINPQQPVDLTSATDADAGQANERWLAENVYKSHGNKLERLLERAAELRASGKNGADAIEVLGAGAKKCIALWHELQSDCPPDVAQATAWFVIEIEEIANRILALGDKEGSNKRDTEAYRAFISEVNHLEYFVTRNREAVSARLRAAKEIVQLRAALREESSDQEKLKEEFDSFKQDVLRSLDAKTQADASANFEKRAGEHKRRERVWYGIVGVCVVALLYLVVFRWSSAPTVADLADRAFYVLLGSRVLALTAIAAIAQVGLRRSNLERNLRLVYEHRIAAITQAPAFIASFADDEESRSSARAELARLVFSDPTTGYREVGAGELSLGPLLAVKDQLESISKK